MTPPSETYICDVSRAIWPQTSTPPRSMALPFSTFDQYRSSDRTFRCLPAREFLRGFRFLSLFSTFPTHRCVFIGPFGSLLSSWLFQFEVTFIFVLWPNVTVSHRGLSRRDSHELNRWARIAFPCFFLSLHLRFRARHGASLSNGILAWAVTRKLLFAVIHAVC